MPFDINILPMNLSEGRNIGDLNGLFLFRAPRKTENSRQQDIFIVLFTVDNTKVLESKMSKWASILAEAYFAARGSFTMGMNAAVKKLAAYLEKENSKQIFPSIYMNAAVLRGRTLMIAHAGPVHSTVISSNSVQNFSDSSCLPIQMQNNQLSFFSADLHSEDIILLCPHVPNDWTNAAIMEVTGDSPLNAIRFLLDRSEGNLQAAVIQLKSGRGQISLRSKTVITANVKPEKTEGTDFEIPPISSNSVEEYGPEKPLIRKRRTAEIFAEPSEPVESSTQEMTSDETEESSANSLTGDQELPGAQSLPFDFTETESEKNAKNEPKKEAKSANTRKKSTEKPAQKKKKSSEKFNTKRFLLILLCGILIPVIVVSVLFFVYSGRSNNQLHEEYLSLAVSSAQLALTDNSPISKESKWIESLNYVEQALNYGTSPAATDLKLEAMNELDRLNGGIATYYNYANQSKLPQGLIITDIAASGQYTYALDATSGSVLRFIASGSGFSLDNTFTCAPGTYPELGGDNTSVQVGALRDFIILPTGSPHNFVLAGVDANANVLYCSGFSGNRAGQLKKTETSRLEIQGIAYANNAMYILDSQASTVWEYLYSSADGFAYEPSNYYGSYSPYLSDIIDFTMYKEYAYFLKENGTLLMCDYTAYRPVCDTITEISSSDGTANIGLSNHQFRKIFVNSSPDNSIYIMDSRLQSVLNLSVKANFIRYIVPNRTIEEISQFSNATGFGITGQNRLIWSYQNDLYVGNMP